MLIHGGNLQQAIRQYTLPREEWIDLSTGINPTAWPVPQIPDWVWSRLPESNAALEASARAYYKAQHILAVAGSQAAIQQLPTLRNTSRVGVLAPGYDEHAHHWAKAGHEVTAIQADRIDPILPALDVLVLINPNNPDGTRFSHEQLIRWHAQLQSRAGWLIIDEAFMDATPEQSFVPWSTQTGVILLRSLGKFFGLAGIRLGFVCAQPDLLSSLQSALGPWHVNTPAQYIGTQALNDHDWQKATSARLVKDSQRLHQLLTHYIGTPNGSTPLFQWTCTPNAQALHEALARDGIWTRLFHTPSSLRFGLPANEIQWQRLTDALKKLSRG